MKYVYIFLIIAMFFLYALHPARPLQIKSAVEKWGMIRTEISQELFASP